MAGRLFRDYYGLDVPAEDILLSPFLTNFSFQDTLQIVGRKALHIVNTLLDHGHADPSFRQSRQSRKTALHQCAEHCLTDIAKALLKGRANPNLRSLPSE